MHSLCTDPAFCRISVLLPFNAAVSVEVVPPLSPLHHSDLSVPVLPSLRIAGIASPTQDSPEVRPRGRLLPWWWSKVRVISLPGCKLLLVVDVWRMGKK